VEAWTRVSSARPRIAVQRDEGGINNGKTSQEVFPSNAFDLASTHFEVLKMGSSSWKFACLTAVLASLAFVDVTAAQKGQEIWGQCKYSRRSHCQLMYLTEMVQAEEKGSKERRRVLRSRLHII